MCFASEQTQENIRIESRKSLCISGTGNILPEANKLLRRNLNGNIHHA